MYAELYAGVTELLLPVAPSSTFAFELATNERPPRYVWLPLRHSFDAPWQKGNRFGPNAPRSLFVKRISVDVHCWGETHTDAERLEQALVTALREALQRGYEPKQSEWLVPQHSQFGHVVVHSFDAIMTLNEAAYTWPVVDRVLTTTTASIEWDGSQAQPTDGVLEPTE